MFKARLLQTSVFTERQRQLDGSLFSSLYAIPSPCTSLTTCLTIRALPTEMPACSPLPAPWCSPPALPSLTPLPLPSVASLFSQSPFFSPSVPLPPRPFSLFPFPFPIPFFLSLSLSFFLSPVSPSLSSSRSNHLASTNDIFFARDISREIYFASLKYSLVVCVLRSERKRERGESNDQRGTRRIVISLFAGQRRSSFQEGRFTQFANVCSAF